MAGLFTRPEDLMAAQQAEGEALARSGNPNAGAFFNLGRSIGGAGNRGLFGVDTRSEQMKRSQTLQQVMQGVDLTSPESIVKGIKDLGAMGYQPEAFKLAELLPTPSNKVTYGPVQESMIDVQDDTGNITKKKYRWQRGSDGSIRNVESVTSSGELKDPNARFDKISLPETLKRPIKMEGDLKTHAMTRISKHPNFQGVLNNTELENIMDQGLESEILKVAKQLKQDYSKGVATEMAQNPQLPQFFWDERAMRGASDEEFIDQAIQTLVEAGDEGIGKYIKMPITPGFGGEVDVPLNNTVSAQEAMQAGAFNNTKSAAVAKVATEAGKLVVGDPSKGELRLGSLPVDQAKEVFSRIGSVSNEEMAQQLTKMGFVFNDELFDSHSIRWNYMRNNPRAANMFLSTMDTPDYQGKLASDLLKETLSSGNVQAYAEMAEMFKYLQRIKPVKDKTKNPRVLNKSN